MKRKSSKRQGLILLVVLGMLGLFSLLAVTYAVVSSQSRASSLGMARRDFRGTPSPRILDSAMRIALRGTSDPNSALWHHDLLADIYGAQETPTELRIRGRRWAGGMPYAALTAGDIERPMILAGRFLRIPISLSSETAGAENPSNLPADHDVWVGRVVTFLEGPLVGQSFRVIRYIGDTTLATDSGGSALPVRRAQNHSIVIDLEEAKDAIVTVDGITHTLLEWANLPPAGQQRGLWLCYSNVQNSTTAVLVRPSPPAPLAVSSRGYRMLLNAPAFNSHGLGVGRSLAITTPPVSPNHTLAPPYDMTPPEVSTMPYALQPRYGLLGSGAVPGDSDESYDAADYSDFWLSHRNSGASSSLDIIPSFHRPALINYIANWKDPATYADASELIATVLRIERAMGRPLSYRIVFPNGIVQNNVNFSGTNTGSVGSSQLDVVFSDTTSWANASNPNGVTAYLRWLTWLTAGPWDVDSDADTVMDSVWVDPNLPLETSREGKLLKTLVSYSIESLDSRLDLNAVGNLVQAQATYDRGTGTGANIPFASGAGRALPAGVGYGPAESSLRHFFASDAAYQTFLTNRYSGRSGGGTEFMPGIVGNDLNGQLLQRERRPSPISNQFPSLPSGVYGRYALGLDHLGNPLLTNHSSISLFGLNLDQFTEDPYESRLVSQAHNDLPFTLSEWERMARPNDWDRSSLPSRLKPSWDYATIPPVAPTPVFSNPNAVTPLSRHLRSVPMPLGRPTSGGSSSVNSNSMYGLLTSLYAYRFPTATVGLSYQAFTECFPIEFHRSQGLNINRPLGNGVDDDGDGRVDEPAEVGSGQFTWEVRGNTLQTSALIEDYTFGQGFTSGNIDPAYEATPNPSAVRTSFNGNQSRQLLARNLYCLGMLIFPDEFYPSNRQNSAPVVGPERARMIAQWAVNVVDFRDADSAMTRFAYDPDPFDDASGSEPFWLPDVTAGEVVWGHEGTDVVMTESLFFHDVRVKDTSEDDGGGDMIPMDDDYDQYRLPEGSGFFELLCLRTPFSADPTNVSPAGVATGVTGSTDGMYVTSGGINYLNLGALTPATGGATRYPVYRIAISAPHPGATDSPLQLQQPAQAMQRANTTYQLSMTPAENGLGWDATSVTTTRPFEIDRVVLFTQPGAITIDTTTIPDMPASVNDAQMPFRVFNNRSPNAAWLEGGQYLAVGPRQVTYLGSRDLGPMSTNHRPNHHRIVLESALGTASNTEGNGAIGPYNNWVTFFDSANDRVENKRAAMRDVVSIIAATDVPWVASPGGGLPDLVNQIGLNVSAPHGDQYYLAPREVLDSNDTTADPNTNAPGYANMRGDAYFDFSGGTALDLPDEPFDGRADTRFPLGSGAGNWMLGHQQGVPNPGTQEDWCTAFLQRLADPERPWHEALNPYITIDWMPIDLTVFSGEEAISPTDPDRMRFASRQKSGAMAAIAGGYNATSPKTFLSYDTTELYRTDAVGAAVGYFDRQLEMDTAISGAPTKVRPTTITSPNRHFASLGYLNSSFELMGETSGSIVTGYRGAPANMPSNLYWADRPFTNALEIMMVPLTAPGQLGQEFNAPAAGTGVFANGSTDPNTFTHLPNFTQSITGTDQLSPSTLFSMIETPSPWSDTEEVIQPGRIVPGHVDYVGGGAELDAATNEVFATLRAPYNRISKSVEPGRVNINDVAEPNVWQGIMWSADSTNRTALTTTPAYWDALQNSRRGYTLGSGSGFIGANPNLHEDSPTQFAGVFKSPLSAGMTPTLRNGSPVDQVALNNPAETSVLRGNASAFPATPSTAPLFATTDINPAKHPFTEYLPATRLANLTTTRSNVFSVRVTVGYFEYDPSTGIGREYGEDDGTVKRHSAFYVIDRSIPVGYQEGQDLNTDNCILVRRIIE